MLLNWIIFVNFQFLQMIEIVASEVLKLKMPAMSQLIAMMITFAFLLPLRHLIKDAEVLPVQLLYLSHSPLRGGGHLEGRGHASPY